VQRYQQIAFCPRCGSQYGPSAWVESEMALRCAGCDYVFYQNSVPSVSMVIPSTSSDVEALFVTRATEPHAGKIALPGGFLRYDEPPMRGVVREVLEETRCM
jgi:NADH pyrophosphatase NudC (nudix superfamily)